MQWRKKLLKQSIIMLLLLSLIVGCSSQGSNADSSDNGKVSLTMNAWGNPAEIKVYQRALDGFMKENPDINVKLVPVPGDQYEQKLLTQVQGSKGPDIFYSYEPTIAKLIETDQVQPLNDYLSSEESYTKAEDFPEGLWGPAKEDGEVYGITTDANPMVMYYNKNVFKEAGVKTPQEYYDEGNWNWNTFKEVTEQLRDAGKSGFIMENWWAHWYSWVWSNGGRIFDEEGNFVLDKDEKAQEAIKFIADLVKEENAVYAGSLPQGQGSDAMFMSNQVGMLAAGRWFEPSFNQNKSLDYDYIYWPSNTGKNEPVGVPVAYMTVNKKSKNVEEAMKFLSYYTGAPGQRDRLAEGGSALASHPEADADVKTTIEHSNYLTEARDNGFTHGSPMAYDAQIPGLSTEMADTFDLMFLGKQDADKTIDKLVETITKYLNESK
jgi:multiple sugar transport system substrate-binding protein